MYDYMVTFYNRLYYTIIGGLVGHNIGMIYYIYSLIYNNKFLLNSRYTIIDYSLYGGLTGGAMMYLSYSLNKWLNN